MPGLSSRHPRYTIFLTLLVLVALFLLLPDSSSYNQFYKPHQAIYSGNSAASPLNIVDAGLPARVAKGERVYEKMLAKRKGLLRKFGGDRKSLVPFPPDKEPWPAYTFWDFFPSAFNCPHELEQIGNLGDGGKWVCGLSRLEDKQDCVIYSLGVSGGSSFESELLSRTKHCQVWGYDFTVSSFGSEITNPHSSDFHNYFVQPLSPFYSSDLLDSGSLPGATDPDTVRVVERAEGSVVEDEMVNGKKDYWNDAGRSLKSRTHFKSYGVTSKNVPATSESPAFYTIESLMNMNGHTHIDILKIDIEGWEIDALTAFVDAFPTLPIGQLQIEMHIWGRNFDELVTWFERLESAGLRAFMMEPNLIYQNYNRDSSPELAEYAFINVKNNNAFISDIPVSTYGYAYDAAAAERENMDADGDSARRP